MFAGLYTTVMAMERASLATRNTFVYGSIGAFFALSWMTWNGLRRENFKGRKALASVESELARSRKH